jgi:hypothetical protein
MVSTFVMPGFMPGIHVLGVFSSEVETGSREENATKQKLRASALIPSKRERL